MKKGFIVLSLLFVPLFLSAENKIKMVTYFPVPYVAYSKINAQKQLDVGLTSACEMNLGCAESGALGTKPLQATTANLNRGQLDLNNASAVKSTNVTLGSGSGEANIDFEKNLHIATLNNGYSLESDAMTVDELKLFASHMRAGGEKFPSCAATGVAGAPQISWQKLKLKNAEEVYLMCGTPKESACNPPSGESTSQSCGSGYTGTQTRTWNYTTCKWNNWQGTCTCSRVCQSYEQLNTSTCTCEPVYTLVCSPGDGMGLFINNRREMANATHTVQLSDEIGVERPGDASTRWYVNNQYVGTGAILSFSLGQYAYSASQNRFVITYQ